MSSRRETVALEEESSESGNTGEEGEAGSGSSAVKGRGDGSANIISINVFLTWMQPKTYPEGLGVPVGTSGGGTTPVPVGTPGTGTLGTLEPVGTAEGVMTMTDEVTVGMQVL